MDEDRTRDARRAEIHRAAVEQFSQRGYAATSMIHIATAAGLSRPALYQYFRNKEDVFASALVAVFEQRVAAAMAAFETDVPLVSRIDGLLQRFEGDLWESLAATEYADELLSAKSDHVAGSVGVVVERLWRDVENVLAQLAGEPGIARGWIELLRLAPKGYLSDSPPVATFRRRLSVLARTVAADIESQVGEPA